jgi:predicted DNA-binding transcriptional regulator AlpA
MTATAETIRRSINDRLLGNLDAADFLGVKPQTLDAWRLRGCGPQFFKVGRLIKYRESDLLDWLETRRCANTAEADALQD